VKVSFARTPNKHSKVIGRVLKVSILRPGILLVELIQALVITPGSKQTQSSVPITESDYH